MGEKLVSRVPDLLKTPKERRDFIAHCMLRGMSNFTARRIANGETNVQASKLVVVANVLNMNLGDLF